MSMFWCQAFPPFLWKSSRIFFNSSCQGMLSVEGTNEIHQRKVMSPKNINQRTLKTFCSSFLSEGVKKETSLPLPPLIFRCSHSHRDIFSVQRFVEARILLDQNFTQGTDVFAFLKKFGHVFSSASTSARKNHPSLKNTYQVPSTSINKRPRRFWTRFSTNQKDSSNLLSLQYWRPCITIGSTVVKSITVDTFPKSDSDVIVQLKDISIKALGDCTGCFSSLEFQPDRFIEFHCFECWKRYQS